MSRLLGLDYGTERVGAALSDPTGTLATPIPFLRVKPFNKFLGELKRMVRENEVSLIVIGIPRNMDGTYGPAADNAREFARRVEETITIPIELFDERLTTVQAEKSLRASGKSAKKQKFLIDSAAAQIILQSYLDHRTFL
ncbi:MAG: Holliday junction resolvase RuvX [Verrucomicrobiota bacterium]